MNESTMLISQKGNLYWKKESGELHRDDGPAVVLGNGVRLWYQDGERHREDGPAVIYGNGYLAWYQRDICISEVPK